MNRRIPLRGSREQPARDERGTMTAKGARSAAAGILVAVSTFLAACSITIEDEECEYVPPKYVGTQAQSTGYWRCAP